LAKPIVYLSNTEKSSVGMYAELLELETIIIGSGRRI